MEVCGHYLLTFFLTFTNLHAAKGVLVVCDLTREKTFEAVRSWKLEIDEWARTEGREGGIPVVLIANKVRGKISAFAFLCFFLPHTGASTSFCFESTFQPAE